MTNLYPFEGAPGNQTECRVSGTGCVPSHIAVDFVQLGLTPQASCGVTDLWSGAQLPAATGVLNVSLKAHASLLVKLANCSSAYANSTGS